MRLLFLIGCVLLVYDAALARNLVINGDFTQAEDGTPVRWAAAGDDSVSQSLTVAPTKGNSCAKLVCTRCEARTGGSHAMLAQVGVVGVEKQKVYEFSARMRAEGLSGHPVKVALQDMRNWQHCGLYRSFTVGSKWKTVRRMFRATRPVAETSRLQFWFTRPGTLYVDDVQIIELEQQALEFTNVVPPAGTRNLVPNGSFEARGAGWSSLGDPVGWGGNLARLHGHIEDSGGSQGKAFLRIPLGKDRTPVLHFDYLKPVVRPQLRPLAASLGWIPVEPGADYTLSCDMRASGEGVPAALGVRSATPRAGQQDYRREVGLSTAWRRYSFTFRPKHRYAFVTIGPRLSEDKFVHVDLDAVQFEKAAQPTAFIPRNMIEVGVEPSQPSGVFQYGEQACLLLRAHNHGNLAAKVVIEFTVLDFFDVKVSLPSMSVDVPAGSTVRREIVLPRDWKGFYHIEMRCATGGRTETKGLRIAIVPPQPDGDSILGINHAFPTPYLIRLAKKAGIAWYRDWSLKWQDIEPSPGEYRWEVGDEQLNRVLKEDVGLLPLLPPFPSADWISEASPDLPTTGYPGVRLRQAWAPQDPEKLAEFVSKAVERYKDRIQVWEFLNEPIFTSYALPGEGVREHPGRRYTPADYVELLRKAASAMRAADPRCKVIGGIAGPPDRFTREVLEAGCLKHVDIFNLHMYPGERPPEGYLSEMDGVLKMMREYGGPKPIWITEFSYYGTDDIPARPFFEEEWAWANLLGDEQTCAAYTIRFLTIMLARGVEKAFIHAGTNGPINEWRFECCLFAQGGTPRKVFPALGVFTRLLGSRPKMVRERILHEGVHCLAFETEERSVVVLWSDHEDEAGTMVTSQRDAKWVDIMGRKIPDGSVSLAGSPVYLTGPARRARQLADSVAWKAKRTP